MLEFIGLLFSALLPSSEAEPEPGPEPASGPAEPAPGSAETVAEPPEAEATSGVDGDSPSSLKKESPDQMVSGGRGWPRVGWPSSLEDH